MGRTRTRDGRCGGVWATASGHLQQHPGFNRSVGDGNRRDSGAGTSPATRAEQNPQWVHGRRRRGTRKATAVSADSGVRHGGDAHGVPSPGSLTRNGRAMSGRVSTSHVCVPREPYVRRDSTRRAHGKSTGTSQPQAGLRGTAATYGDSRGTRFPLSSLAMQPRPQRVWATRFPSCLAAPCGVFPLSTVAQAIGSR